MPEIHAADCKGQCGGNYVCARCHRVCGWCFGAADDYYDYCDDCVTSSNCVFCGEPAQGEYSIHTTDAMDGPDLPLCNVCGGNALPAVREIWDHIENRGLLNLRHHRRTRRTPKSEQPPRSYDPNDESMFETEE